MRIDPPSPIIHALALSALSKPAGKQGVEPEAPVGPVPRSADTVPVHSVATLVALSAIDPATERRRERVRQVKSGLDCLDRLQRRLLAGVGGPAAADALEGWPDHQDASDDPMLEALYREVRLRILVELAKRERD